MNVKDFFEPTWNKLIIFFILILVFSYIPFIGTIDLTQWLLFYLTLAQLNQYISNATYSFYVPLVGFLGTLYRYFLGCLIIFIYKKIKNKRIKK